MILISNRVPKNWPILLSNQLDLLSLTTYHASILTPANLRMSIIIKGSFHHIPPHRPSDIQSMSLSMQRMGKRNILMGNTCCYGYMHHHGVRQDITLSLSFPSCRMPSGVYCHCLKERSISRGSIHGHCPG